MEEYSDTDSIAELEYETWDEARAWEFRNARGYTNVDLSHNSRMNRNREYVSDVDTPTQNYTIQQRNALRGLVNVDVRRRMFLRRILSRYAVMQIRRNVIMENGLLVTNSLR